HKNEAAMRWTGSVLFGYGVAAILATGCATPFERQLGTTAEYHAILKTPVIAPSSEKLLQDGPDYLIGIEKGDTDVVQKLKPCAPDSPQGSLGYCLNLDAYPQDSPWRTRIARDNDHSKTLFVSHIARLDNIDHQKIGSKRVCFLYNIYPHSDFPEATDCGRPFAAQTSRLPLGVMSGLTALEELEQELDERLAKEPPATRPTHVLVMSTGWNTLQAESLDNYQHWTSHLKRAARDEARPFRPLVIGISWPSEWPLISSWLGPVISVFNKEHDADEVGYITVNVLVHKVLNNLKRKHNVQIVVIGHSFGGRVMATALNSRALLFREGASHPTATLMLGLQPAFSIQRFGDGDQGDPYRRFFQASRKYLLTSSTRDWILTFVGITNPVGSSRGLAKAKERPERFEVVSLDKEGQWQREPSSNPCQLVVLDGSEAISGHHDVYGAAVGRLMWEAIRSFAPASSWSAAPQSVQESPCTVGP
ncbi:MAG TPA: alpha/beta hydrolase, partial [Nitrospira sp.]|nr:alpha/beta hydrolase [Nitrospira sp.]